MEEAPGKIALCESIGILQKTEISYWLGRGAFRDLTILGKLSRLNSDLDFHIHFSDAQNNLDHIISNFQKNDFSLQVNKNYKLNFIHRPTKVEIEIVFLFQVNQQLVYHQSKCQRLICDGNVFQNRKMNVYEQIITVPNQEYLPQIFGCKWNYLLN